MIFSKVKYISDYVIEITFSDGVKKYYDFRKWLFEMCQPVYYQYRKPELFKKARIDKEFGHLSWGKGNEEMDFLPEHIEEFEVKRKTNLSYVSSTSALAFLKEPKENSYSNAKGKPTKKLK